MGNTLKMDKIELLNRLFSQGWSIRKINRSTGIHRSTVSSYHKRWLKAIPHKKTKSEPADIRTAGDPDKVQSVPLKCPPGGVVHFEVPTGYLPDPVNRSKSNAHVYQDQIKGKLKLGQSARSIYQDLYLEENYRGSYCSIKRYIRKIKRSHPRLYARIETPPGEEAQVDFGQGAPTLKNGRYFRPWLFVMTLSNSRKSYEEVVWSQDVETFIRCHERAFERFDGVTKIVKLDNLKSGVLQAHLYDPELNPTYQAFSEHCGFIPLPCRVATPEHKGKVEAGVKYVQNNALKGKRFKSIEEQNAYLRNWNRVWATTRIHGTTKRQVGQMFKEERSQLKSLPESSFTFFKISKRKVNSLDSHIEVQGAYYPVPPQYMGRQVDVQFNSQWVKVLYNGKTIQWLSAIEKGRFHPDKRCLPAGKTMDRNTWQKSLLKRCSLAGRQVKNWADLAIVERGLPAYRSIQGVISLSGKYSSQLLNRACWLAVERKTFSSKLVRHYLDELSLRDQIKTRLPLKQEGDIIRSPRAYARLFDQEVQS